MLTYKIIDASQAKSINLYLNTKRKLLKCNANKKFNQISLAKYLTPQCAKIKISGHQSPARHTEKQVQKIRIKYEVKYLYKKKLQLNLQPYRIHLDNSKKMEPDMGYYRTRYILKTKNRNERHIFTPEQENKAFRRKEYQSTGSETNILQTIENLTNIQFTMEETNLLQRGLFIICTKNQKIGYKT
jgi:hypothetical protein